MNRSILKNMEYFGLGKNDIDNEGFVTLYHGTVNVVSLLKKGEIFFMTSSGDEAKDYARMRQKQTGKKGVVMTIRVKPEDVYWNQGSQEVEFSKGGKIIDGTLYPTKTKPRIRLSNKNISYKGVKVGDILPKTGFKVLQVVVHPNNSSQFLVLNGSKKIWYDADTVIEYEFS